MTTLNSPFSLIGTRKGATSATAGARGARTAAAAGAARRSTSATAATCFPTGGTRLGSTRSRPSAPRGHVSIRTGATLARAPPTTRPLSCPPGPILAEEPDLAGAGRRGPSRTRDAPPWSRPARLEC